MQQHWLAGIIVVLALATAVPAAADCVPLLATFPSSDTPEMTLSDCDVQAQLTERSRGLAVVLAVREPALARWRAALGGEGVLARAMLAAELRLDGRAATLPGGHA